jgi:Flp pilus assembly protein TadD
MTTTIRSRPAGALILVLCATLIGCGHTSRFRSRRDRAEADRRHGLEAGQTAEIQLAMGRSFEAEGDYDKAMAAYREAAQTDPKRHEPQIRIAILLDRLGRFAEAVPYYNAALKASPGNAEVYADRGYSLCLQGRDSEGEVSLRQAIAIEPRLARAHNNLGALLARAGRTADALAEFRKAGCPETDAQLNLAFALGQGGRWDEARKHLEIARRAAPSAKAVGEDAAHLEALIARAEMVKTGGTGLAATSDPAVVTTGGMNFGSSDTPVR